MFLNQSNQVFIQQNRNTSSVQDIVPFIEVFDDLIENDQPLMDLLYKFATYCKLNCLAYYETTRLPIINPA